jgi:hypothetical protein
MALTDEDKAWIKQTILEALDSQFDEQFVAVKAEIEKVETKLLTAFHEWASPVDARLRAHTATLRALDLEQEAQDARLKKLEGAA